MRPKSFNRALVAKPLVKPLHRIRPSLLRPQVWSGSIDRVLSHHRLLHSIPLPEKNLEIFSRDLSEISGFSTKVRLSFNRCPGVVAERTSASAQTNPKCVKVNVWSLGIGAFSGTKSYFLVLVGSTKWFLSAAIGQRPRNYLSCCCPSPFGSFPLKKIFKWKKSPWLGIKPGSIRSTANRLSTELQSHC